MVGRTRLIRTTSSPLISGWTRRPRKLWPRMLAAALVLAALGTALWYFFLR